MRRFFFFLRPFVPRSVIYNIINFKIILEIISFTKLNQIGAQSVFLNWRLGIKGTLGTIVRYLGETCYNQDTNINGLERRPLKFNRKPLDTVRESL